MGACYHDRAAQIRWEEAWFRVSRVYDDLDARRFRIIRLFISPEEHQKILRANPCGFGERGQNYRHSELTYMGVPVGTRVK